MQHLMIDLETLGTSPNAVFLSVAAVQFDLDGTIGDHFKINIDLKSALAAGLNVDASTLQWWLEQRPEIMKLMFVEPVNIRHALERLKFFITNKGTSYVWGNSARFDLGILENAYRKLGIELPWSFRNERCYRTMVGMFPPNWNEIKTNDVLAHDPVYDCHKQIRLLTSIWKMYSPDKVKEMEERIEHLEYGGENI